MNTPTMTPGTVEMVSVEWLMKNADYSVDGFKDEYNGGVDYLRMVREKGGDWVFPRLVQTIMTKGFRVPIVMVPNYIPFWGGGVTPVGLTHGNGHHRMAAAIMLCLDEIPVYWSDSNTEYMCVSTSATESVTDDTELVDGLLDNMWELY